MLSEFSFTPPPLAQSYSTPAQESVYADQDGDLDVPRRHASCVLTIGQSDTVVTIALQNMNIVTEHTMATPISGVGTQVCVRACVCV